MAITKVPQTATSFNDTEAFAASSEDKGFEMLAYSGKPIMDHWYWGNLAIDVSGIKFEGKKFPILEDHWTEKRIGFSKKPKGLEDNQIRFDDSNFQFIDSEESIKFREQSKQGFPFQASISGQPIVVERFGEGEKVEVNGYTLKGPGAVWREWIYRESSVVVFGADNKTHSRAFADNRGEIDVSFIDVEKESGNSDDEGGKNMPITLEKFREENPEAYKAEVERIVKEEQEKAEAASAKALKAAEDASSSQITTLTGQLTETNEKLRVLEKQEVIRQEKDLKREANAIWSQRLSESDIPERLHAKARAMVSHDPYVKEGVLDTAAFTEAVDKEIKSWIELGVSTDPVTGMGTVFKVVDTDTSNTETEETQTIITRMQARMPHMAIIKK